MDEAANPERQGVAMNDLLTLAVDAHGGLVRWNQFKAVNARMSVEGVLWQTKGHLPEMKDLRVEARLQEQHLVIHYVGFDKRTVFTGSRVNVETESGRLLDFRENPRSSYAGQVFETPWDDIHTAYFTSYALWTYLTIPFVYTYPGFAVTELSPWMENGELWRSLQATFPESIPSHTQTQVSYFGPDGLLRRHEYTVDVLGGAPGLNYALDYREVQGIMVPTKRRVYAYDAQKQRVPAPLLVAIDIHEIAFS
jgi:hypothetical protein